ncbi:LysR family transcriptional regulator [Arenibacterium sp. LLYu02]|uniref:LysR family transcriptional regulator n=1 Tax=Arenibacterium sp. LLYu02 TaxID=3404132 RepID=UPI003B217B16
MKKPLSDNDLRLARVFCKIVDCGGIAAAEASLGVGRSTISRQLQDFETRLGVVLCERGRGGFRLTQEGAQTLAYVEALLAAVDNFSTDVAGLSRDVVGKVKLGLIDTSTSDPRNPIRHILKTFQTRAPNARLEVSTGAAKALERKVLDGQLHFALIPEYWQHEGLETLPLYQERVGLFAGRGHPIAQRIQAGRPPTRDEVLQHSLVFRGLPEPPELQQRKSGFVEGARSEATEAVLALVSAGLHLGFLPAHLGQVAANDLVELLPEAFSYEMPISLIHRKDRLPSALLKHFLKAAKQVAGAR